MFLLCLTGNSLREEEGLGNHASDLCVGSELNAIKTDDSLPSPSSLWPTSHPSSSKKMDGYILSLVQKKTHPVRTNKPRTSVNADPTKGLLRNGSVCVRAPGGVPQGSGVNLKHATPMMMCLPSGGMSSLENGPFSPPKQRSKDSKPEQLESKRLAPPPEGCSVGAAVEPQSKHLPKPAKAAPPELAKCPAAGLGESPKESHQVPAGSPKTSPARGPAAPGESKAPPQPPKKMPPKSGLQTLDFKSEGSTPSLEDGPLVKAHFIPGQQPPPLQQLQPQHQQPQPAGARPHRAHRHPGVARGAALKARGPAAPEHGLPTVREKTRAAGKKCRFPDDSETNRRLRKASSKARRGGTPDAGLPGRTGGGGAAGGARAGGPRAHAHAHGREPVVAKPKHKRTDYRRWKPSAEVSYEEALRRARRGRREPAGAYPVAVALPYASPYAYVASDSEYSAECESLFHSTVVDTSEDEQSNYTTNCFGDSESSVSEGEFVGESTTTSDSEESGGLIWSQFVQTLPLQTVTAPELHACPRKTFVKIKASHNLKKKILRFRSGSLKLMTTV